MRRVAAFILTVGLYLGTLFPGSFQAFAQGTFPGLLGPGQILGNYGTGQNLPAPQNSMAAAASCPSWLSSYQLLANTASAPTGTTLNVWDKTQCVTLFTLNETTHVASLPIALFGTAAPSHPQLHQVGSNSIVDGAGTRGALTADSGHALPWLDESWVLTGDQFFWTSGDPSALVSGPGLVPTPDGVHGGVWSLTLTFGGLGAPCHSGCIVSYTAAIADSGQTIATKISTAIAGNANLYNNVSGAQGQILQVNDLGAAVNLDANAAVPMSITGVAATGGAWSIPAACATVCSQALDINPVFFPARVIPGRAGLGNDQIFALDVGGNNSAAGFAFFGVQALFVSDPTAGAEVGLWTWYTGAGGNTLEFKQGLTTAGTTGGDQGKDTANFKQYYQNGVPFGSQFFATTFSAPSSGTGCMFAYSGGGFIECQNWATSAATQFEILASQVQFPNTSVAPIWGASSVLPASAASYAFGSSALPFSDFFARQFDLVGSSSGDISIKAQAAAGTYNFNLPTTAGSSGQPLLSGGGVGAAMTFGTLGAAAGGTGLATITAHGFMIGEGTSNVAVVGPCTNGQFALGQTAADPACTTLGGDVSSVSAAGLFVLAKVNGVSFPASGTSGGVPYYSSTSAVSSSPALALNGVVIGGGTGGSPGSIAAGTNGQLLFGVTSGAPQMASLSQDCTVTNAGVITCTKTNNALFTSYATAAVGQLPGTATNDSASAGNIGEYVSSYGTNGTSTVTITNAAPGIVSWTGHGLTTASPVNFTTTGGLPTGLVVGTNYYVCSANLTANSFAVSTSVANAIAGTCVTTSSAGSGTHTAISTVIMTTGTNINLAGISLTAGDWEVSVAANYIGATTTTVQSVLVSASSTSATADSTFGRAHQLFLNNQAAFNVVTYQTVNVPSTRFSLSGTTTLFAVAESAFGTSTESVYGIIKARRVR